LAFNGTGFVIIFIFKTHKLKVMYRITAIIWLIIISAYQTDSQIIIKGVMLDRHSAQNIGDTVILCGMKVNLNDTSYYIKDPQGYFRTVPSRKLLVLDEKMNYFDKKWFENEAIAISKRGWNTPKRIDIEKQTLNYLADLKNNSLLYEDIYLEDYLMDLLKEIHPVDFYKGRTIFFTIKILNSEEEKIYTFENGTILISTQLIANASNEKELFEKMVQSVAHIIFDHSYNNIDSFSLDSQKQLGIIYNAELSAKGRQIAKDFMKFYISNQNQEKLFHDNNYFIDKTANVVSYTAWQEYYSQHYIQSLNLVNKIIDTGFGIEEDYLLRAKLYQILRSDDDALKEALSSLEIAESLGNQNLMDIYSEKGILLIKMSRWNEALEAFLKYREMITNQPDSALEMKWCTQMIHKCRQQTGANAKEPAQQ
jgi:hypothetical protein